VSYRDELGQAHARIAQLEEQLREERAKRAPPGAGAVRRRISALVICLVVLWLSAGVIAFVVGARSRARDDDTATFVAVDQVVADEKRWVGMKLRVQGELVGGTTTMRTGGPTCDMRFTLERNGLRMLVRHAGCPPETFRDVRGLIVVVQGKLGDDGVFAADEMLVRMPDFP
jgi:cytochrome c-type biogenesis protein CcmE